LAFSLEDAPQLAAGFFTLWIPAISMFLSPAGFDTLSATLEDPSPCLRQAQDRLNRRGGVNSG